MSNPAAPQQRKLLKLASLSSSQLPAHPLLAAAQNGTAAELVPFVTQMLSEGAPFADTTIPSTFKHVKTSHSSQEKGGDVEVIAGGSTVDDPKGNEGRGEYWFGRRSRHVLLKEDTPIWERPKGRARWQDLREALLLEHSVKEGEYTPDIFDARKVIDWNGELNGVEVEGWRDLGLEIFEMVHDVGQPLNHRCFATLVLTAVDSESSFMDLQIPVELSKVDAAFYSNGKHKTEGANAQQKKKVVMGQYVSVERCKIVKEESGEEVAQWDMATASDARGALPMAVQKIAITGVVAKDVGFVMDWLAHKRAREEPKATSGGAAS